MSEERCAHCGQPAKGYGHVQDKRVCHPDNKAFPDCYRLVTVYGEPLGARKVPVIKEKVVSFRKGIGRWLG